ncbi:MAG: neutral/alkaline non-lysosomal ceramidase N-terminal domain-containing protein [Planctomycetes bacterium]|nr:neutral/alkaline non-lysosomal ceramidase N-terminal domain-containing protein [Planctomycetota bacterium]
MDLGLGPGRGAPLREQPVAAITLALLTLVCLAGCQSPEPFRTTGVSAGGEALFLAGVASVEYTPEAGYPLGGYGGGERRAELPFYAGVGWPGHIALACHQSWHEDDPDGKSDMLNPATGADEPLTAKALVLRPDGQPPFAFVRIDAIGVTSELHDLALEQLGDLGFRRETLVLAATHTHSGPGAFFRMPIGRLIGMDNFRPELEAKIASAIARAVRTAYDEARPAALGFGRARDRRPDGQTIVAKNRRFRRFREEIAYDEVDDEVGLLYVTEREDRSKPIALLVNYAVHSTVYGSDHLRFSTDLAGGLERGLEAALGAPVLFFNGAEGDIAPRRGQKNDPPGRCEELGILFAEVVTPTLSGIELSETVQITAATGDKQLGSPQGVVALGRERFLDSYRGWASWPMELFTLPFNLILWTTGLTNVRIVLTWNFGLGIVAHLGNLTPRTTTRVGAVRLRAGPHDVSLVTFPGEATHDVGLEARARAKARGATQSLIVGLALDHVAYLASPKEYRRGGYEAHSTLFGEHTATQILDSQEVLLDALGWTPSESSSSAPPK